MPGVKARAPKRDAPPTSRHDYHKEYDKKRKRTYNTKWETDHPWLKFTPTGPPDDMSQGYMQCCVCLDYFKDTHSPTNTKLKGQNTFISGCSNLRVSTVIDHEKSNAHDVAFKSKKAKQSPVTVAQSRAGKALRALKEADRTRLGYLIRNAHAIAKQNRPLSDYTWLSILDKAKGADMGQTYLNDKAGLNFITVMAEIEMQKTQKLLDEAPFFSFIMDGSTELTGRFIIISQ